MSDWHEVPRLTGPCFAHNALPVWVVHYPATHVRGAHWQGYIATEPIIKGQHPCRGGVSNRRVGSESGFETFAEACEKSTAAAGKLL
jgi:hypothetical protein